MKISARQVLGAATASIVAMAVGTTVAVAATAGGVNLSTTGVKFDGSYKFYPGFDHRGGLGYTGLLADTAADGNSVFIQSKVVGYRYANREYNKSGKGTSKKIDDLNFDGAMIETPYGWIQVCQDRGTLISDLCAVSGKITR